MAEETKETKALVLEIKVPQFYAEDLEEQVKLMKQEGWEPRDGALTYIVTEEMVRREVGLSLVSLPSEKCLNSDFQLINTDGVIVGARVVDA